MSQSVTATVASNRIRGSVVKLAPYSSTELVFYVLSVDRGSCWVVLSQEAVRKLAPDIGLSQKDLEKLIIAGDKPAEKLFGRGGAESPFCVFELDPTVSSLGTYQKEKIYAAVSGWRDNPKLDTLESTIGWRLEEGKSIITPVSVPFVPVGHKTRIGYAVLDVPITYIEQNRMSQVDNVEIIRGKGTIKKALGHTYESFTISYIAKGPAEIEKSVRDVLEQLSLYPFTTAEGGPFGALDEVGDIPYHELAVRNVALSTIDNMPGAVQVDISFDPFIWDWFCPPTDIDNSSETFPRVHMDDMICWPLFKVWARLRQASTYHGGNFNGVFKLSMPSIQASREFTEVIKSPRTFHATDTTALQTLDGLVTRSDTLITSRFAKEILPTQPGPRHFVVKVSSEDVWKKLTTSAYYVGLLLWERVQNWNYVDDEGRFLPQSGQIYEGYLNSGIAPRGSLDSPELSAANTNLQNPLSWIDYQRSSTVPPGGWKRYGVVLQVPTAKEGEFLAFIRELEAKQALPEQLGRETLSQKVRDIFNTDEYATDLLDISPLSLAGEADVIVERISSNKGHKLATTSIIAIPLPLHEYMGALDATFLVEGKCFGTDAKRRIENIKDEFDRRALLMSSAAYATGKKGSQPGDLAGAPFIRVENEIFQLMGVHFVMPVTMNFNTVEGQPDVWEFTISFVSFDPETRRAEQVQFLPTSWQNLGKLYKYGGRSPGSPHPMIDKGREYFSLQASLAAEEVYQDMQLPTYGELETWIRAIHAASKPTKNMKSGDLIFQSMIKEIIGEFLEDSGTKKLIESWKVPSTVIWPEAESSAFADPDFFCYYCKDDTFLSSFDTIAKKLLGKRTDTQRAEGVVEETETAGFRFQDPGPGVTTIVPSKYTAADATNNHKIMETVVNGHGIYSFPEDLSRAAATKQAEVKDKLDSRDDRWWQLNVPIAQETAGGTRVPINYPGSAGVYLDDNSLIPQVNHPQEVDGKLVDLDIQQVDPSFRDFLRVAWRQKAARMAAGRGILRALHIKEVYPNGTDSGFLLSVGDGWRFFENNMPREVGTVISICKKTGKTLDQFTSDWIDREIKAGDEQWASQWLHTVNEFLQESMDNVAKIQLPGSDWVLGLFGLDSKLDNALTTSKPGWIGRVARVNSNYAYYLSHPGRKVVMGVGNGRSARQSIEDSADFFDAVGAERHIDPNILRAFFMRRDHFGALQRAGSQDDSGFGDLYTHDPALKGLSNAGIIKEIADRYSSNLETTGNIPTLALLKTHIQSTSTREKYFVDGKFRADVDADFRQAGERIGRLYRSAGGQNADSALAELQAFVQKYDREGAMNLYHSGYIEICRAYGSYINPQIRGEDMLFHPLNPLIVIDMYADRDVMVTQTTPSGQTSTMRFDRRDINPTPWEIEQLGNDQSGSLRDEANRVKKFQASIDPKVEDAVYGMLSDLRNHSPFGRLLGAFPSYQILFINEGFYWAGGNQKLWDQFYTRTAVSSIEVFRSRHFASSTCNIVFSNMFHQLTAYNQMESLAHEMAVETNNLVGANVDPVRFFSTIGQLWNALLLKNPPGEIVDIWRRNQLQALALTAGIRLQVRLGYGSNASKLPVVFSGTIMSAPVDDGSVMVQAFGDGAELEKQPGGTEVTATMAGVYQDKGGLGIGKSPSNIVTEVLIGPYLMGWLTHGMFRDWSQSNTSHFGDVVYEGTALIPRANVGEFSFNIYNDRTTTLEQNVQGIRNFFNLNAIYNWGNENTFCIQVNEPTVWKVVQVCRRACLDFVATAESFGTRSTLFFGKWWWPYNYTYDPAILDVKGSSTEDVFQDALLRSSADRLKGGMEIITKPFVPLDGATGLPNVRLEERVKKLHDLLDITYKSKGWIGAPPDRHLEAYLQETINGDAVAKFVGRDIVDKALSGKSLTKAEQDNLFRAYQRWRQTYQDPKKAAMQAQLDAQKAEQTAAEQGIDWGGIAWEATGIPMMKRAAEMAWPLIWNYQSLPGLPSWGQALDMFSASPFAPFSPFTGFITFMSPNQVVGNAAAGVAFQRSLYGDAVDLLEYTRWKPLCQAYIAHSCINLVSNKIEASAEKVYTDAVGIHTYNGFLSGDSVTKTNIWSVDSDIQPADRRTMYVDTGILLTGWTAGFTPLKRAANQILNPLTWIPGPAQDALQTPTTPAIQNSVIQSLIDSVKEMYQGWFTIMGQTTIKPHDLVIITDHKHKISGPVWVKEVIHRLDAETGLKTFISPDCVAMPHTSLFGAQMVQSLSMGVLGQLGSFMALKAIAAGTKAALLGRLNAKTGFTNAVDLDTYYELLEKARSSPLEMSDKFDTIKKDLLSEPRSSARLKKRFPSGGPGFEVGDRVIDAGQSELNAYRREISSAKTWEELEDVLQRYGISGVKTPKRTTLYGQVLQHERDIARGALAFDQNLSDAEKVLSAKERKAAIDLWMKDRRIGFVKRNLDEVLKVVVGDNEELLKTLKELRSLGNAKRAKDVARQKELLAKLDGLLTDEDKVKIIARLRNANLQPLFLDRATVSALEAVRETLVNPVKGAKAIGSAAAKKLEGLPGALKALISRDPNKGFERVAKQPGSGIKFVQVVKNVGKDVKAALKGEKAIKDTAIASKVVKAGARTGKAIRGVVSGARLAKYVVGAAGGPVGEALMLLIDIAQFLAFDGMIEGLNNLMKARQCVKIYPLTAGGVPYLAGIRGHQGAVLGDYPSWMDELYMNLLMPSGMNVIGWTAAIAGLEAPNYARSEIDAQVMEIWEEQRKQDITASNDALRQEREGAGVP